MRIKTFFITAITAVILFGNALTATAGETVRGFLVDLKIVDMLTERGAEDIKIFAAYDTENKPYYIMAGLDNSGALIPGKVYRQNETGDCPPTCEFLPTKLTNGGAFIEVSEAKQLIKNYMSYHIAAKNVVKVCAFSLNKVKAKGYHYMRVTFEKNIKVTGVKDDGKVKWFAPFTNSCNTNSRSSLDGE